MLHYVHSSLFIIARSWKEPRCPSTEEWIQKMWYIYTMEDYLAIKNNDFMKFLSKWMDLEGIILSEVNQSQKNSCNMYSMISGYYPRNLGYPRYKIQFAKRMKLKKNEDRWDGQKHRAAEAAPLAGRRQPATVRTRGQVSTWLGRRPQPQQQRSPPGFRDSAGPRKLV